MPKIELHYFRKRVRFGFTIVYLTKTFWKIHGEHNEGFLGYDEIKISRLGQLICYWSCLQKYRDHTKIFPKGTKILRVTKNYIIIK